ncbi:MAG TPA: Uma2 family endonuclease [Chloroflexota bacterium]
MLETATSVLALDPMHLEGWEEQDEPLASDRHSDEQTYCFTALRYLLNPDGHYVSMDRWLRMDPADHKDKLLPDFLIALDVLEQQWNVDEYLPWEVGKPPEVLGEFLSPTSEGADQVDKPKRYGELGVREYFLFDPDGTYGVPRIQGWTLRRDGSREALPRRADGGVQSRVLPVRFLRVDDHVGVIDVRSGRLALRYEEVQRLLLEEAAARLRAEQARQQAEQAQQQAEQAQQREIEARQRAEQLQQQESATRVVAEAEMARLRAELERLRRAANGDDRT